MRTYTAVIERDPETGVLLEDGEPPLEAEFVGTQTILVA
jgi:hypothetical protein